MSNIQISLASRGYSNCLVNPSVTDEQTANILSSSITRLNTKIQAFSGNHESSSIHTTHVDRYSFMLKMWTHLLAKETAFPHSRISVRSQAPSYSGEEVTYYGSEGNHRDPMTYFSLRNDEARNSFNVCILQIKRGLDMIALFNEQAPEWGLRLIPELNMHVTMHARHRVNVYEMPENKGILIITNNQEDSMLARILGSVWCSLEMFGIKDKLRATSITESKFLQFCKVLYDEDLEAYHLFVDTIVAEFEAYYNSAEYLTEQLKACQTATSASRRNSLEQRIQSYQNDIENYEDNLNSCYVNKREYELKLMTLTLSDVQTDQSMLDLIAFLQKAKNTVKMIKVDKARGTMILEITTPLNTYRRKDVEMYYKHPNTSNALNRFPKVLEAFQKTFIDEEYDMVTTTRISLALAPNGDSNARGISDYTPDLDASRSSNYLRFGNPHIERHNCFTGSKREVDKALANNDYVMAIAQLISACSSITFTDSTVISSFTERIAKIDNETPLFKRRSDGAMLSLDQLHEESKPKLIPKPKAPKAKAPVLSQRSDGETPVTAVERPIPAPPMPEPIPEPFDQGPFNIAF